MLMKKNSKTFQKPKRVVVIGATGFIGSSILNYFKDCGIETFSISSKQWRTLGAAVTTYLAENLDQADTLIVLAAITPDKSHDSFQDFIDNIKIAKIICEALKNKMCSQVVYFSSDAVYSSNESLISEETQLAPSSLYGMMHLVREKMFRETVKDGLLIIRSTQVYGTFDTHNSYGPCRMLRSAMKEEKIYLFGEGLETRDHIFIDDLIKLIDVLLQHRCEGVINAVTGVSISFQKLAAHIINIVDKNVEIVSVPSQKYVTHRQFDPNTIKKNFENFRFLSFQEGLAKMYYEIYKLNPHYWKT